MRLYSDKTASGGHCPRLRPLRRGFAFGNTVSAAIFSQKWLLPGAAVGPLVELPKMPAERPFKAPADGGIEPFGSGKLRLQLLNTFYARAGFGFNCKFKEHFLVVRIVVDSRMSVMNLENFVKDVMLSIMRATVESQKEADKIGCGCEINPEKHLDYSYGLSVRAKQSHAEIFRVDEAHFDVAVTVANESKGGAYLKVLELVNGGGEIQNVSQSISRVSFSIPYRLPT